MLCVFCFYITKVQMTDKYSTSFCNPTKWRFEFGLYWGKGVHLSMELKAFSIFAGDTRKHAFQIPDLEKNPVLPQGASSRKQQPYLKKS